MTTKNCTYRVPVPMATGFHKRFKTDYYYLIFIDDFLINVDNRSSLYMYYLYIIQIQIQQANDRYW